MCLSNLHIFLRNLLMSDSLSEIAMMLFKYFMRDSAKHIPSRKSSTAPAIIDGPPVKRH